MKKICFFMDKADSQVDFFLSCFIQLSSWIFCLVSCNFCHEFLYFSDKLLSLFLCFCRYLADITFCPVTLCHPTPTLWYLAVVSLINFFFVWSYLFVSALMQVLFKTLLVGLNYLWIQFRKMNKDSRENWWVICMGLHSEQSQFLLVLSTECFHFD